jgi:tetratricopeptide (TPR) repeat protein
VQGSGRDVFVGREHELATVDAALDRTSAGRGQALVVAGPAGIGKTRLLLEVVARARERGIAVAWAGCTPDALAPPLWPWAQLLRALARDRDAPDDGPWAALRHHPSGPGGDPDLARQEQFAGIVGALHDAARSQPLILVIDDLHWADAGSLRLLGVLAPTLPGGRLSVVAAHRDDEVDAALAEVRARLAAAGRTLHLTGLASDEVGDLAAAEAGHGLPARAVAMVHRHTGGNPLFARELVALLDRDGHLDRAGRPYGTVPLPEGIRAVLDAQLSRADDRCQAVLSAASVIGDEFDLDLLAPIVGRDPLDLLADIDGAVAARMVRRVAPGRFAFVHPLIREAAHDRLASDDRVRLHERAGRALQALESAGRPVDPAALARHFIESAPGGTAPEAVRYARAAGDQAMAVLAYEDAAVLYGCALDALPLAPGPGEDADLLLALGDAQQAVGRRDAARISFERAAAVARTRGRADLLARAALGMGSGPGGFEVPLFDHGQVALLDEASRALGAEPSTLRVRVDARRSVASTYADTVEGRRALSEAALSMGRSVGDPAALGAALAAHCDAIAGPSDVEQRTREAAEIIELATQLGDRGLELLGRRLRVLALVEVGDVGSALTEVEAYAVVADRLAQPLYSWYVPLWRGADALMHGRLEEWTRHVAQTEAIGERAQSHNALLLTVSQRWAAASAMGGWEESRALLTRITREGGVPPAVARLADVYALATTGHVREAASRLDGVTAADLDALPVDAEWLTLMSYVGDSIALLGGHPLAEHAYGLLLPHAERWVVDGIWAAAYGPVHRFLAMLAGAMGRSADARAHADRTLAICQAGGWALLEAEAHLSAGRACGDPDHLAAARDRFGSLGLVPRVQQANELLDALGNGPAVSVPRDPTAGRLHLQGDVWELTYDAATIRLRDAKALHDLARLLTRPHAEVHVLQLAAPPAAVAARPADGELGTPGDLGEVLDGAARRAYRTRLADLEAELDEAERFGDGERAALARAERDALAHELAAAIGLGGRARRRGDPAERARSAVTRRIREMITRIEAAHPTLGRHLRHSVRTGTYCAYEPDEPVTWEVLRLTP